MCDLLSWLIGVKGDREKDEREKNERGIVTNNKSALKIIGVGQEMDRVLTLTSSGYL